MQKTIKISNIDIPVTLHPATVIHSNKYSEASGGAFNFPVWSTLYTDVVFRLNDTREDYKAYIKNTDLPIYTQQEVTIFCTGRIVLGYVDMQTNNYYYTTKDFARLLGLGPHFAWVLLTGVLAGVAIYFIQGGITEWCLAPMIVTYIVYLLHRWNLNRNIRKEIDAFLSE